MTLHGFILHMLRNTRDTRCDTSDRRGERIGRKFSIRNSARLIFSLAQIGCKVKLFKIIDKLEKN